MGSEPPNSGSSDRAASGRPHLKSQSTAGASSDMGSGPSSVCGPSFPSRTPFITRDTSGSSEATTPPTPLSNHPDLPLEFKMDFTSSKEPSPPPAIAPAHHHPDLTAGGFSAIDVVEADPRPAFILDLSVVDLAQSSTHSRLPLIYSNEALRLLPAIRRILMDGENFGLQPDNVSLAEFHAWAIAPPPKSTVKSLSRSWQGPVSFQSMMWSIQPLSDRYRIVAGFPISKVQNNGVEDSLIPHPPLPPPEREKLVQEAPPQEWHIQHIPQHPVTFDEDYGLEQSVLMSRSSTGLQHAGALSISTTPSTVPYNNQVPSGKAQPSLDEILMVHHDIPPPITNTVYDWTTAPIESLSPHIAHIRSTDWAHTEAGPIHNWPHSLRTVANLVVSTACPALIWWGPKHIYFYNEAYIPFLGDRHPEVLGKPLAEVEPERYQRVRKYLNAAWSGLGTVKYQDRSWVRHNGRTEEIFFSWNITPIVDRFGNIRGVHAVLIDATDTVLQRRRGRTLWAMLQDTASATHLSSYWANLARTFEHATLDVPFALIYRYHVKDRQSLVLTDNESRGFDIKDAPCIVLERYANVPEGHHLLQQVTKLEGQSTGIAPYITQAMHRRSSLVLSVNRNTIDKSVLEGLTSELGSPVNTIIILPLFLDGIDITDSLDDSTPIGFMILGISPNRPFDRAYREFFDIMFMQIRATMSHMRSVEHTAAAKLFEMYIRNMQPRDSTGSGSKSSLSRAASTASRHGSNPSVSIDPVVRAAGDKTVDTTLPYLKVIRRDAWQSAQVARMAEFLPIGIFTADTNNMLLTHNRQFGQIVASCGQKVTAATSWLSIIHDDDRSSVEQVCHNIAHNSSSFTTQFRLKLNPEAIHACTMARRRDIASSPAYNLKPDHAYEPEYCWMQMSGFPLRSENGHMYSIFASLLDITAKKNAETMEIERQAEAIRQKSRLEHFIDMTSHEMRNPLSSVTQAADSIAMMLRAMQTDALSPHELGCHLSDMIENLRTVQICSSHQLSMVNDTLMLCKLDSDLIRVNPKPARPLEVIYDTLKMFELKLRETNISLSANIDASVARLGLGQWARFDPVRLRQIMINLMTNAIRFTCPMDYRRITVSIAAAVDDDTSTAEPSSSQYKYNTLNRSPLLQQVEFLPGRAENASQFPDHLNSTSATISEASVSGWGNGKTVNLIVSVRDTGPGLGSGSRKRLFERFQKALPRTHALYGGSGLGLFICRDLVELHGGRMGVASYNTGATFSFYLKTKICEDPETLGGKECMTVGLREFSDLDQFELDREMYALALKDVASLAETQAKDAKVDGAGLTVKLGLRQPKSTAVSDTDSERKITVKKVKKIKRNIVGVTGDSSATASASDARTKSISVPPVIKAEIKQEVPVSSASSVTSRPTTTSSAVVRITDDDNKTIATPNSIVEPTVKPVPNLYTSLYNKERPVMTPVAMENAAALAYLRRAIHKTNMSAGVDKEEDVRVPVSHCLLVEDNMINARTTHHLLAKFGCTADVAENGLEAMEYIRAAAKGQKLQTKGSIKVKNLSTKVASGTSYEDQEFKLVLMDLEMPKMNGLDCSREIRRLEKAGELSGRAIIIAVTAFMRHETIENCRDAQMDGFIGKPFDVKDLIYQLNDIIVSRKDRADLGPRAANLAYPFFLSPTLNIPQPGAPAPTHLSPVSPTSPTTAFFSRPLLVSPQSAVSTESRYMPYIPLTVEDTNAAAFRVPTPPTFEVEEPSEQVTFSTSMFPAKQETPEPTGKSSWSHKRLSFKQGRSTSPGRMSPTSVDSVDDAQSPMSSTTVEKKRRSSGFFRPRFPSISEHGRARLASLLPRRLSRDVSATTSLPTPTLLSPGVHMEDTLYRPASTVAGESTINKSNDSLSIPRSTAEGSNGIQRIKSNDSRASGNTVKANTPQG